MEWMQPIVEAVSGWGFLGDLATMTSTDLVFVFLASKPVFLFTAAVALLAARSGQAGRAIASEELPEDRRIE